MCAFQSLWSALGFGFVMLGRAWPGVRGVLVRVVARMAERGRGEAPTATYRLLREVGRGGFGTVWLAKRHGVAGDSTDVALKFPRVPEDVDVLRDELSMMRAAAHPGVVPALGFVTERDIRTSTSERSLGQGLVFPAADIDLSSFIRRHGALAPELSLEWARTLASALAHMHDLGLLAPQGRQAQQHPAVL